MRFTRAIVLGAIVAVLAGVFAPSAAAFRFTDTARLVPEGRVGQSYSHWFETVGGTPPATVALDGGSLPPGLTLNRDGRVTGTPTQAGSWSFWLEATDAWENPMKTQEPFTINIAPRPATSPPPPSVPLPPPPPPPAPTLAITTSALGRASVGVPYSVTLTAQGAPTLIWSVSAGTLPAGLALSSTGTISGTPTTAGSFAFTANVTDGGSRAHSRQLTLQVLAPLAATVPTLQPAEVGRPFVVRPAAPTGGLLPYKWSVAEGTLPAGLALVPETGAIGGIPAVAGSFPLKLAVVDANGSSVRVAITLTIAAKLTITTQQLPRGKVGRAYQASFVAQGGVRPLTWRILSGTLPHDIRFDSTSGAVVGRAHVAGTFSVMVQVVDMLGAYSNGTFVLTVQPLPLAATAPKLPLAEVGAPFSVSPKAPTGGLLPYKWSIVQGTLPTGLALSPTTGVIAGTPAVAGSFGLKLAVADASGLSVTLAIRLIVAARLTITTQQLRVATVGRAYRARLETQGGVRPLRWTIVGGALPRGLRLDSRTGALVGTPRAPGTFSITVHVVDALGMYSSRTFALTVRR